VFYKLTLFITRQKITKAKVSIAENHKKTAHENKYTVSGKKEATVFATIDLAYLGGFS